MTYRILIQSPLRDSSLQDKKKQPNPYQFYVVNTSPSACQQTEVQVLIRKEIVLINFSSD